MVGGGLCIGFTVDMVWGMKAGMACLFVWRNDIASG